ncbi:MULTISPECIES: hypothetical protein [Exiguobacterium]|uniref:hypothetical protein n=1 Tax=Exiguobacterium TaxID=33986 RepID=UPI001BE6C6B7|nr:MULTISPECIES: hypothetical protein [Exiguobacterium]MCT4783619.1 hypothetical protein [Exiguobacterium himgiriensis]
MIKWLPVLMVALIVGNALTILGLTANLPSGVGRLVLIGGPALTLVSAVSIVWIVLATKKK